jgi:hypothetical protein
MTTSGTYSFSVSRDDIIRQAMLNIGKLDEGETPTAGDTADCARILNMLVKQWQGMADFAPGLKTWTRRRGYLFLSGTSGQYQLGPSATGWTRNFTKTTLSASVLAGSSTLTLASSTGLVVGDHIGIDVGGDLFWTTIATVSPAITTASPLTASADLGAKVYFYTTVATQPVVIEAVVLRDNDSNDTPLRIMEQRDYDLLPSKADVQSAADPIAVYHEFQLGTSYLYTDSYGSTDMTKYIVITYLESIQDFNNPLDTPEYPQEWYLPICWGLAEQIAPMYHVEFTPLMSKLAASSLAIAQKKEPQKQTMYFRPGEDDL